jgi:hypothetical protein
MVLITLRSRSKEGEDGTFIQEPATSALALVGNPSLVRLSVNKVLTRPARSVTPTAVTVLLNW